MAFFYFEPGVSCLFRSCHCKSREGGRGGGWRGGGAVLDLVEEKRVHNTQPKYSFLAYEKSYTFREDMSARFLNAIKTDFEL